jgi:hypothetical protein
LLKLGEVVHVLDAEVVPVDGSFVEIESPDFGDFVL